jgi:hypothetical protein
MALGSSTSRGAFALLLALAAGAPAQAIPTFSIDAISPAAPIVSNSSILLPAAIFPPAILVPPPGLGLIGAPIDELNAITTPGEMGLMHISVDRFSVGVPGFPPDVASEAAAGQAAGDIYVTGNFTTPVPRLPLNALAYNQAALAEIPPLPPGAIAPPPIDDLDALDLAGMPPAFYTLLPGHPYLGASGFFGCGGDIFAPGLVPAPVFAFAALGLLACGDAVDALHFHLATGIFYFSLAPGSPSLAPGSPIVGCALGCSAADIFAVMPGLPPAALAATAALLGLFPGDNVDGLAGNPCLAPSGADGDGDLLDDACDNCVVVFNPTQTDSDVDGYGNACDPDYDNSGVVAVPDFILFSASFAGAVPPTNPAFDNNESGFVDIPDFIVLSSMFGGPPGPSGLACAGTVPCTH